MVHECYGVSTVSNGATLAIWGEGQEKGKKKASDGRHDEKTLTDLTVLVLTLLAIPVRTIRT
jgi:hypothetical protein